MGREKKTPMRWAGVGMIAAAWAVAAGAFAAAPDGFGQYLDNTFVSHHRDGVVYRVGYGADRRFELTRKGGPDPGADFRARGTYTVDPTGKVCFAFEAPAPRFPACVTQDITKKVGESWDYTFAATGDVERHSLLPGRQLP